MLRCSTLYKECRAIRREPTRVPGACGGDPRESMCRLFYDVAYTMRTAPLHPLRPNKKACPADGDKAGGYGYDDSSISGRSRWFLILKVTQDRVVLEIQRGCIRGCRFCQAGMHLPSASGNAAWRYLKEHAYKMLKEYRT